MIYLKLHIKNETGKGSLNLRCFILDYDRGEVNIDLEKLLAGIDRHHFEKFLDIIDQCCPGIQHSVCKRN